MKRASITFLMFLVLASGMLKAQIVSNVRANQQGNEVIISYDLEMEGETYISLEVSENGGRTFNKISSMYLSGDVDNVNTGGSKKMVWEVLKTRKLLYGDEFIFKVNSKGISGVFVDPRDNEKYRTIKIGGNLWMQENLRHIPKKGKGYRYVYDNKSYTKKYGLVYKGAVAQEVCPVGWRLPTRNEFQGLLNMNGKTDREQFKNLIEGGKSKFEATLSGRRINRSGSIASNQWELRDRYGKFWTNEEMRDDGFVAKTYYILKLGYPQRAYEKMATISRSSSYHSSVRCLKEW